MRRLLVGGFTGAIAIGVAVACSSDYGETSVAPPPPDAAPGVDSTGDAAPGPGPTADAGGGTDAARGPCSPTAKFGEAHVLSELSTGLENFAPHLAPDELTIVFARRPVIGSDAFAYLAHRASRMAPFEAPTLIVSLLWDGGSTQPMLSANGLTLFFTSLHATPYGDVFLATRPNANGPFGAPALVPGIADNAYDGDPFLSSTGDELFFASSRGSTGGLPGNTKVDLYRAVPNGQGGYGTPLRLNELSTDMNEVTPTASADGLALYFATDRRAKSAVDFDIWVARRPDRNAAFGLAQEVVELNTSSLDRPGWLSPDQCRLYFESSRSGARAIYVAERSN